MIGFAKNTIKISDKCVEMMKACKKLMSKMMGMCMGDASDLDDDTALMLRDSMNLMNQAYDYAELQAKQFDQINERLEDLEKLIREIKKNQEE